MIRRVILFAIFITTGFAGLAQKKPVAKKSAKSGSSKVSAASNGATNASTAQNATIKGSRQALKTGIFHISFNILSIILGLLFFDPFLELVNYVSHRKTIEHAIANAHMLFNITGVLIFVWTLPLFEKILNKILPDAKPG
jgi:Na+/phosphate symporter